MAGIIPKAWTGHVENLYNGVNSSQKGTLDDTIKDVRPAPKHTSRGPWRPPTSYSREVWDGDNNVYMATAHSIRHDSRLAPKWLEKIDFSGARNAGGQYATTIPNPPGNLESQAIIKARLKFKNQAVNLGQIFAEREQSIRLIGGNLRQLVRMVRDVKRGRIFRKIGGKRSVVIKRPTHEDFHNRWLELQYGWLPLMSDCHGVIQALHESESDKYANRLATVKANVSAKDVVYKSFTDQFNNLLWTGTKVQDVYHKAMIRLDFEQDMLPTSTLANLGISNPLELAWELLPWSFVADWFIPVGDYLSSLDAFLGWQFKGGSYSVKSVEKSHVRITGINSAPYMVPQEQWVTGRGSGRKMKFSRNVYINAPSAVLPSLAKIGKSSPLHVLNGIALLSAAITGGHKVK